MKKMFNKSIKSHSSSAGGGDEGGGDGEETQPLIGADKDEETNVEEFDDVDGGKKRKKKTFLPSSAKKKRILLGDEKPMHIQVCGYAYGHSFSILFDNLVCKLRVQVWQISMNSFSCFHSN